MNTNNIFETKEEHLAFRKKWKELHSSGFHKPVRHEYQHGGTYQPDGGKNQYGNPTWSYTPGGTGFRMVSPLTAWHHLVFNLAIGRDPMKAFGNYRKSYRDYPPVWHALNYTQGVKHDFEPFGDSLDDVQKITLTKMVAEFKSTL